MDQKYYTWLSTPVGMLVISGTEQYVSKIGFYDTETTPESEDLPDTIMLAREEMQSYFHGNLQHFTFPFAQPGTGFQQRVWYKLMEIPFSKTISYLELAHRLDDPKIIRAAASANGHNNLAVLVPCHRVIGSNGKLVGYAGGLWRKQWLLDHEQRVNGTYNKLF